jgi:hypothetical protein
LFASLSSLGPGQRLLLFGWSALVAGFVIVGLIAAVTKPRWWGADKPIGWFEVALIGGLGFIPLISNALSK